MGAYSKDFVDIVSTMNNQAALAEIKQVQFGIYGERRFMLNSMGFISLMLAVPAFSGGFGFQFDYFGFGDYNESEAGLAYGRKLGENVNIGAKFNYYMLQVNGYGKASTMNVEMGCTWALTPQVRTGLHVCNPVARNLKGDLKGKLPLVFKTGFGFEPSEQLLTGIEAIKEEDSNVNIKAVIQYRIANEIMLRASVATGIESSCIAIGYAKENFRLELAFAYHQQLGFTPGLLMAYKSGKKRD